MRLEKTCLGAAIKRGAEESKWQKNVGGVEPASRAGGKDTSSLVGDAAACCSPGFPSDNGATGRGWGGMRRPHSTAVTVSSSTIG